MLLAFQKKKKKLIPGMTKEFPPVKPYLSHGIPGLFVELVTAPGNTDKIFLNSTEWSTFGKNRLEVYS